MSNCRSCNKEIYFLKNEATGGIVPVNADSMSPQEVSACIGKMEIPYDKSRHVSHFKDCPNANNFSKKSKFKKENK